jgi:hypothetical protein
MSTIEQQIIERIHRLSSDDQKKVLEFMDRLHQETPKRYSPRELMRLPAEERDRLVAEAFDRAATMDFETFEAYTEELDDQP